MPGSATSPGKISVLACQIAVPDVENAAARDAHLERIADRIDGLLATRHADLVVLPELSAISYSRAAFDRLDELAEGPEGPSAERFGALARKHRAWFAFGVPRVDDGRFFISHMAVNPDGGYAGCYDKIHTAQFGASMEKDYFARGGRLLVLDVDGVRVAPIICYDFRFPDLTATLRRRHDIGLLIHPVAFYRDRTFPSWHHIAVARAVENQSYYLSLNRAGEEYGSSLWCPPWVDDELRPETFGTAEEFRYFSVDPEIIRRVRSEFTYDADRLSDYAGLASTLATGAGPADQE